MAKDLYLGGKSIKGDIYHGRKPVVAVYKGGTEVWRKIGAPYRYALAITEEGTHEIDVCRGVYNIVMIGGGGKNSGSFSAGDVIGFSTGGNGAAIIGKITLFKRKTLSVDVTHFTRTALIDSGNVLLVANSGGAGSKVSYGGGAGGTAVANIDSASYLSVGELQLLNGAKGAYATAHAGTGGGAATNTPNATLYDRFGNAYGFAGKWSNAGATVIQPRTGGYFSLEYVAPITE